MLFRTLLITACTVVMAASGIFGTFYDPGHPWMDRKRKIGVAILFLAGGVGMAAILIGQM